MKYPYCMYVRVTVSLCIFLQNSRIKSSSTLEKTDTPRYTSTVQSVKKQDSARQHVGYDVVEEVIRLLGRMEDDRLSTQQMLVNERQRVNNLRSLIDGLAFQRLTDLPSAVQKGTHIQF